MKCGSHYELDKHLVFHYARLCHGNPSYEPHPKRLGYANRNLGMFHIGRRMDICSQDHHTDTANHGNDGSQRWKLAKLYRCGLYEKSFRNVETDDGRGRYAIGTHAA